MNANLAFIRSRFHLLPEDRYASLVEDILKNFDFERVSKVMAALDWVWGSANGVPSSEQLRAKARQMLLALHGQPDGTGIRGGGLEARISNFDLELLFVISRSDASSAAGGGGMDGRESLHNQHFRLTGDDSVADLHKKMQRADAEAL